MSTGRSVGWRHRQSCDRGGWDLVLDGGLVVEVDEELPFNRYRAITLAPEWTSALPWRNEYAHFSEKHERLCLAAGRWGKRWSSPPCERMFGPADPPGTFNSGGGPRWKQRALYDAMKDVAAVDGRRTRLARLSTLDVVSGVQLGLALQGRASLDQDSCRASLDQDSLRELLERRTLGGDTT